MENMKSREIWVDNVKVIACILVALGHFFMSMVTADVLPDTDLYQWFRQTIYYFHVPLFFICSGYLYQKLSKVDNVHSWWKNVLEKALNLGVPYFAFSFATWLLKTVFSSSVNTQIGGLFDTLFIHPTAPCWLLKPWESSGGGVWSASYFIHPFKRNLVCYRYVSECVRV